MTLTVEPFAASPAEWDAFVAAVEGGTHCHVWGWKSVMERVLRARLADADFGSAS